MTPLILRNLPAVACFCGATAVCIAGRDGWGWFLFVGLLLT